MLYESTAVFSTGAVSTFSDVGVICTEEAKSITNKAFPSSPPSDSTLELPGKANFTLADSKKITLSYLDRGLLNRAKNIIDGFNHNDIMEVAVSLESLRGIVLQLWESAAKASQLHQEILAILESAILSVECPTESQLSVFREATMDLGSDILTQAHVDVIRRRFITEGFSPLALLSEVKDSDERD